MWDPKLWMKVHGIIPVKFGYDRFWGNPGTLSSEIGPRSEQDGFAILSVNGIP